MIKKEIKRRRYMRSLGRNKIIPIVKIKNKTKMVLFKSSLDNYRWTERFISLFKSFSQKEDPSTAIYKGRQFKISNQVNL